MTLIPGVLETHLISKDHAQPDLIIEIPHGATATADYERLAAQLTSPLPANLVDFFHVNTDSGAPELADSIAAYFASEGLTALIVRCRIPRTFIDCNRRMDASAADFKAGKVTPGLMPWITTDHDRALLRGLYDQYVAGVAAAVAELEPKQGAMLLLHSYAPRTVDVEVDADIVTNLRAAYAPDKRDTWPLRPEIDVISRATDGTDYAPVQVVAELRTQLAAAGLTLADSTTYPLHPSTLAWDHVQAHPGRAVCIEVRRDLLADPFEPFAQQRISEAKLKRLAVPFVKALVRWWW